MTDKLSERGTIILTDHLLKNGEPQHSSVNDEVAALEQRVERLEGALRQLSDPMVYEGIPIFHGTKQPWLIAKEALASQEEV